MLDTQKLKVSSKAIQAEPNFIVNESRRKKF
jgi:hypothetical protein